MSEEGECSEDESLTHQQQWDDSVLIEAWDSAIEQFQVYHLDKQDKEMIKESFVNENASSILGIEESIERIDKAESHHPTVTPSSSSSTLTSTIKEEEKTVKKRKMESIDSQQQLPLEPTFHSSSFGDISPELQNAFMAWYWAGYYAGRLSMR